MAETLPVHLNRETIHSIETEGFFETEGTFTLLLNNHGSSSHVHLHLDDSLSEVATLNASNHYVEEGSTRPVTVDVNDDVEEASGVLEIVTGYGAEKYRVTVEIGPPEEQREVEVDESLSEPSPSNDRSVLNQLPDGSLLVIGLALIAVFLLVVVVSMSDLAALIVGIIVILAGILIAGYFLLESGRNDKRI
ncbi:MAG: hypothetical protein ABEI06_06335 [Halobacteriaceae archaeon]